MGCAIKICGRHVNTSCRRQEEGESNTQLTREASERKAVWESMVLGVH